MASVVYLLLALVVAASAAPESRAVGGTPVTIEEFPYIVSFIYYYPGPGINIQRCVGSLISSWHVLTSGFCFTGAILDNMTIRAGSTNSLTGGTLVGISQFIKHPDYEETPRTHDVAICRMDFPLSISNTINILYLPPSNAYIPDNTELKIVSWGFESQTGPQMELLKQIFLNKMNGDQCQADMAEHSEAVDITDSVICAQAPGRAMCIGDSGAPMVINNVVVGTSSFYVSCTDDYPAIFTRTDRYTDWILAEATAGRSGAGIMTAPIVM